MYKRAATARPNGPLFRLCEPDAIRDITGSEFLARAESLACGMLAAGVSAGDRVGIVSENRLEWIETDCAIQCAGAITVALHAPLSAPQVREQFLDSDPALIFVSSATQRDKVLQFHKECSALRGVYTFDHDAATLATPYLDEIAIQPRAELLAQLATRARFSYPDDTAAIIYTSGTTGASRGASLTNRNLISNVASTARMIPPEETPDPVLLNWLPLSHIFARSADLYGPLLRGLIIALTPSIEALPGDLLRIHPDYLCGVPRLWEKLAAAAEPELESGDTGALRRLMGGRLRWGISGGAALNPRIAEAFAAAGVPLYQGYGLTETSPTVTCNFPSHSRLGSSGKAIPDVEVRIAEDGEILTRGPHIMKGYWRKPAETAAVIDADGWFQTGDIGELDDDGYLTITDRKKDILVTAYGKNVAPQQIENRLCSDRFIEQAFVYGDARPFLVALLVPRFKELADWCVESEVPEPVRDAIDQSPQIHELFHQRISIALRDLAPHEQVRRFVLAPGSFSISSGELTVTAKLRRSQILANHREQLDALYELSE
ncbi:MAG: long-chain fatty acid--CoA ligase [Armatimonadetes bacterium]|nr:long-chain fatty acid--CoA ligase [Armatimonadota bacterium]